MQLLLRFIIRNPVIVNFIEKGDYWIYLSGNRDSHLIFNSFIFNFWNFYFCEYTDKRFVVYAENGYKGEFITDTINTRGVQDKMKQSYYKIDLEKFEQPSADAYTGSWIPVSVDVFGDGKSGRMIRGNWKSREVELSVSGEEVTVAGLFPSLETNPITKFDLKDGLMVSKENRSARVWVKDSTNVIPSMRFEYQYYPKLGAFSEQGYFYETYDTEDEKELRDMFVGGFVHEDVIAFVDNRTSHRFWALALGGYQKSSMGEEQLQNIIGESHGELILVRKGSEMLKGLKYADQSIKEGEEILKNAPEQAEDHFLVRNRE